MPFSKPKSASIQRWLKPKPKDRTFSRSHPKAAARKITAPSLQKSTHASNPDCMTPAPFGSTLKLLTFAACLVFLVACAGPQTPSVPSSDHASTRSEEHTSELQSRGHLV